MRETIRRTLEAGAQKEVRRGGVLMAIMRRLALGAVVCVLLVGLPHRACADFIDTFSDTTFLGPPGFPFLDNGTDGSADTITVQGGDTASVLGGTRSYNFAYAGATGTGGALSMTAFNQVDGGTFQMSSTLAVTGNAEAALQVGLQYGSATPNLSVSANAGVPASASASVQFAASGGFLADFLGQQGIAVDFESLDAAAVGTVFTLALSDTALNAAELSVTVTMPGAQTLLFPFASLVPTGPSGVFSSGVASPVSLSSIGAVALVFEPQGGSFAVDAIRTVAAAAVPEPSSVILLALGALSMVGSVWRKRSTT